MNILAAVVLNVALTNVELPGDNEPMPWDVPATMTLNQEDAHNRQYDQLRLAIRVPFLGGDLDDQGEKWTDFFSTGFGLDVNGAFLFRTSKSFAIGPYVGTTFDFFSGKTQHFQDAMGDFSLEPDTLVMTRILVGVKLRENLGPRFFMEQYLGFGAAFYSATDITYRDNLGSLNLGLFDSSVAFAFELGFRAGFALSAHADLGIGLAYEANGAPDAAPDFEGVDFKSQDNFVLSFFININF